MSSSSFDDVIENLRNLRKSKHKSKEPVKSFIVNSALNTPTSPFDQFTPLYELSEPQQLSDAVAEISARLVCEEDNQLCYALAYETSAKIASGELRDTPTEEELASYSEPELKAVRELMSARERLVGEFANEDQVEAMYTLVPQMVQGESVVTAGGDRKLQGLASSIAGWLALIGFIFLGPDEGSSDDPDFTWLYDTYSQLFEGYVYNETAIVLGNFYVLPLKWIGTVYQFFVIPFIRETIQLAICLTMFFVCYFEAEGVNTNPNPYDQTSNCDEYPSYCVSLSLFPTPNPTKSTTDQETSSPTTSMMTSSPTNQETASPSSGPSSTPQETSSPTTSMMTSTPTCVGLLCNPLK